MNIAMVKEKTEYNVGKALKEFMQTGNDKLIFECDSLKEAERVRINLQSTRIRYNLPVKITKNGFDVYALK